MITPPLKILSDISIIHKTYKFFITLYITTVLFPKKDRYTLALRCENSTLEILGLLFQANALSGNERLQLLLDCDTQLKILKTCIRLAYDVKAIEQKKYLVLETALQEISRMLGGWIQHTKKNPPAHPQHDHKTSR